MVAADCIFCEILTGRAPVSIVARGDGVTAFMDLHPINPGHVLVVPDRHAVGLADLDPADGRALFAMAQRVAAALRASGLPCAGVNLVLADGEAAGQEVFHAHLHVIPRHEGDGFGFRHPPGHPASPSRTHLDEVAATVRDGLG